MTPASSPRRCSWCRCSGYSVPDSTSGATVPRYLDQVPGDSGAAVLLRLVQSSSITVGPSSDAVRVARRVGDPGARLSGDVSHRDIEAERAIADQIPEAVVGGAVVEQADIVVGQDGLGQGQEHLARDHFDLGHGPVVVPTAPEEGNEEVATRRDDILIEVFTEVDNDFVAVDSRLVLLRDPIVHLEGERPARVPLPAAVLRDVRKDADDDRALIAVVRSQGEGIARAAAVEGILLGATEDVNVVDGGSRSRFARNGYRCGILPARFR